MLPKVHYKYYRVNPNLPKLGGRKGHPLTRYSRGNGFLVLDRHGAPAFLKGPPATNGGAVVALVRMPSGEVLYGKSVCSPTDAFCYRDGRDGKDTECGRQAGARDALLVELQKAELGENSVEW